jgi:hypothetical protein
MYNSPSLLWSSLDANGVVTAALGQMLRELLQAEPTRWLRANDSEQLLQLASSHSLGLALWCVDDELQLPHICHALCEVREHSPATICVAYVEMAQGEFLAMLVEAGAQLVVRDLPSLQLALPQIVRFATRSTIGLNPLTSGIIEQLPWGEQQSL